MKHKEKKWLFVLLGFLILVLYILFSTYPLKKDIQVLPLWTINLSEVYEQKVQEENEQNNYILSQSMLPFFQAQFLGALYPNGNIAFIEKFNERATISKKYWSIYDSDAKNTLVHSMDLTASFTLKEEGFPFAIDSHIFNFFPGGNSFGLYDNKGKLLWSASQWSPISAFSVSKDAIAVGYIDGNIRLFSLEGNLIFSTYPAGSSYELIYGAALSSNTELLAAISGLEPQRFVLYSLDGENSKIIYHRYLEKQKTTERFMQFNTKNTKLFYNTDGGLIVFDIKDKKESFVSLPAPVCSVKELDFENFVVVLSKTGSTCFVSFLNAYNEVIAEFSFTADFASLFTDGNAVYLGQDNFISKMEIVRK